MIEGNTVLPPADLDAIAAPYEGREVTLEELFRLKDELTLAYVNAGYVNSGATLPDQDVTEGTVRFADRRGRAGGDRHHRHPRSSSARFLEQRIRLGAGPPLNVNDLQDRLQLLLQDPTIAKLDAQLLPGSAPGPGAARGGGRGARRSGSRSRRAPPTTSRPASAPTMSGSPSPGSTCSGRNDPLVLTGDLTEGLRRPASTTRCR